MKNARYTKCLGYTMDETQLDRIMAVLQNELPPEILSDEDILELEHRVFDAIMNKQLSRNDVTFFEFENVRIH